MLLGQFNADGRSLLLGALGRMGHLLELPDAVLAAGGRLAEDLHEGRGQPRQTSIRLSLKRKQTHLVDLPDAMGQGAVPVHLVDQRPPDAPQHGHAFLAEPPRVLHDRLKPDLAVDKLAFDRRLGEHQRDAIAAVIRVGRAVEADRALGSALPQRPAYEVKLPVAVRVIVQPQHVGPLRAGPEPLEVDIAHAIVAREQ